MRESRVERRKVRQSVEESLVAFLSQLPPSRFKRGGSVLPKGGKKVKNCLF